MFNKNLIIGVIVVVLLGGGAIYYFFGGGNIQNLPAARNGELTRELAKQIIWEGIKDKPETFLASYYDYEKGYSAPSGGLGRGVEDLGEVQELVSRGLIEVVKIGGTLRIFNFTDKGKAYTSEPEYKPTPDSKNLEVHLAYPKGIEITGITKQSETEAAVQYEIDYTLTPFGEIITPELVNKQKTGTILRLYDDGWRR